MLKFLVLFSAILFCFISCREEVVTFEEIEADGGSLFLRSTPVGAEIFIRNTNTQKVTPDIFEELTPGEYFVTLKLMGFQDTSFVVNIESKKNKLLNIRLK